MMNRKTNNIKILQQEVEIPQIVEQKTGAVFRMIQNGEVTREMLPEHVPAGKPKRKRAWSAVAAAALAMSTITVGAATYTNWSRSLEGGLQITGTQKQALEDKNAWSVLNQSVTCDGVTITAKQCIVDNYAAYIVFKIEGFEMPEDAWPYMRKLPKVIIGNEPVRNDGESDSFGEFYRGLILDEHDEYIHDDGTPVAGEEDYGSFIMEDGSIEYQMSITMKEKGGLLGKPVYIKLRDLCYEIDREEKFDKPRTWEFSWVLNGTTASREVALKEPIGDTGLILTEVEISPISIRATTQREAQSESDDCLTCIGVRTKDGKMHIDIKGNGSAGGPGEKPGEYVSVYQTCRVMDMEQIDALIYIDLMGDDDFELRKGNPDNATFYTVPIGTSGAEEN